jgi:hypothetical protein
MAFIKIINGQMETQLVKLNGFPGQMAEASGNVKTAVSAPLCKL